MIFDPAGLLLHPLFEALALFAGSRYYFYLKRRDGGLAMTDGHFVVICGCLLGAALGNKAAFWLQQPEWFAQHWRAPLSLFFGGQSMVGGLVGGLLGVELAKLAVGSRTSTGDWFVFPILLGLMIGRIGCFLAGLGDDTYGLPTALPWGMDFGDGLRRHPVQLYEILWCAAMWWLLRRLRPRLADRPGLLFKLLLSGYLTWRLLIDALKPVPHAYAGGLSGIQWICVASLLIYVPIVLQALRKPGLEPSAGRP